MADETPSASSVQQGRSFAPLASSLAQIVEDRFDDDQYDQAVELLEQLHVEGTRLPQGILQKLVALSLCSLSPAQVASTSRWTLHHELGSIAPCSVSQSKSNDASAPSVTDRPSAATVLKATSLLLRYSQVSLSQGTLGENEQPSLDSKRKSALLARYILESFPSHRKPLKRRGSTSRQRSRSASGRSDSGHESSIELSSIEEWARNDLQHADDIWDLLCNHRLSSATAAEKEGSLTQVREFWMKASEQRRYQKQLTATKSAHDRLQDKLRQLHGKQPIGGRDSNSSDSDDDDDDSDDHPRLSLSVSGRANKRPAKSTSTRTSDAKSPATAKRFRRHESADKNGESHNLPLAMTEGAWRTLSALLSLWDRASSGHSLANSAEAPATDDDPPLLWQFPVSRRAPSGRRTTRKESDGQTMVDDVSRALDVAFSFPRVLPPFVPPSNSTASAPSFFGAELALTSRGDSRFLSTVSEPELLHRQMIGEQTEERAMASRADTAARLLLSLHKLVQLGYVQSVAFFAGASEQIALLRTSEIQYLMLPLIGQQPIIVAKVLAAYLGDAAEVHPDERDAKASASTRLRFDDDLSITLDQMIAHATPTDEAPASRLRNSVRRDQHPDAKSILEFLSLHSLELDSPSCSSLDLHFPTKSESRSQSVVRKRAQKQNKGESHVRRRGQAASKSSNAEKAAGAVVTPEMKKGGLQALAFVRAIEMEAKDRINQMKFLIARALVALHSNARSGGEVAIDGSSPLTVRPGSQESEDAGWMQDARRRKVELRAFLSRMIKAFKRDSADFEACLSSMKTHLDGTPKPQLQANARTSVASSEDGERPTTLPTFEATADRCQGYVIAAQNLVDATAILSECLQ